MISIDQDAQTTGGGDLLTDRKIRREILRDLPTYQLHAAHIGFFEPNVLDDREIPVCSHGRAHIKLRRRLPGQIHLPVLEVAPGIPMAVRHSCNTAQGASALNAQGD